MKALSQSEVELWQALEALSGGRSILDIVPRVSPNFSRPAHLQPLADAIAQARFRPMRVCVSVPPRHSKTETLLHAAAWWLMTRPQDSIAFISYAASLAESKSRRMRDMAHRLGVKLRDDQASVREWRTTAGGGVVACGMGGAITGQGFQLMIVDDPFKNREEAESALQREKMYDWFTSTAMTRIEPGGSVVVCHCMTGDTPVLMADGTKKSLCDVRPGDVVATFEDGELKTAKVLNWASQGLDDVFTIKMKSGRTVRANARHPFLTIQEGAHVWQRTDQLKPGTLLQAVGGSGECARPLNTWKATPDEILEIVPCGVAEVFDLQIERTENFIANGLVSHNTRWHDDDLIGKLVADTENKWQYINLPAISNEDTPEAAALWPERWPIEALRVRAREVGSYDWASLYQGQPRPKGGRRFEEPARYDLPGISDPRTGAWRILIGVDPAATAKSNADYSAAVVVAAQGRPGTVDFRVDVLDVWRGQVEIPKLVTQLRAMAIKWGAPLAIESVAGFKAVPQMLRAVDRRLRIFEVHPLGDKFTRSSPVAAAWNDGRVRVPVDKPWLTDFLEEVQQFTGVGDKRDDQVDALANAFNALTTNYPMPAGTFPSGV